jgi:hypothetical protein
MNMSIDLSYEGNLYFQATENELLEVGVPQAVIDARKLELEGLAAVNARKEAYKNESDPLYMEWQFDQTTESEQAWRDKVTEIKARYPLTDES